MNTLITLFMLLGSTFARRGSNGGGRPHCRFSVGVEQQDQDLEGLLAPFLTPAADDEGSDGDETMSVAKTTCVMRGLDQEWPHANAVNAAERRLLRRGTKSRVAFNVTDGAFGYLSKMAYDSEFTCYNGGEVSFDFTSAVMTKSDGTVVTFTKEDPRRQLRRGGNGNSDSSESSDDEEVIYPTAVLTFLQVNSMGEEDVSFPVSVLCRPSYRFQRSDRTCALKGLVCHDGEYTYSVMEDEVQEEEEEFFRGMKCIADDEHFLRRWPECAASEE